MSWPFQSISPADGFEKPANMRKNVDLPEPLVPVSTSAPPSWRETFMWRKICWAFLIHETLFSRSRGSGGLHKDISSEWRTKISSRYSTSLFEADALSNLAWIWEEITRDIMQSDKLKAKVEKIHKFQWLNVSSQFKIETNCAKSKFTCWYKSIMSNWLNT